MCNDILNTFLSKKDILILETKSSCNTLLYNILVHKKKEYSSINEDFPPNTRIEDLETSVKNIKVYLYSSIYSTPYFEIVLSIEHKREGYIGYYSLIWNKALNLIDDFFVLE